LKIIVRTYQQCKEMGGKFALISPKKYLNKFSAAQDRDKSNYSLKQRRRRGSAGVGADQFWKPCLLQSRSH